MGVPAGASSELQAAAPAARFDPHVVAQALGDGERLALMRKAQLLDSLPEMAFDRWTRMVQRATGAEAAFVTLVGDSSQFFKSVSRAVGASDSCMRELPLSASLCQYVVSGRAPLAVADARCHPVLSHNPAVTHHQVIAYAGAPVIVEGQVLGSLCVIERSPRGWRDDDLRSVEEIAAAVSTEVQLLLANQELARNHDLLASHNLVHELIAQDAPLTDILTALVESVERQDPSVIGCVVLLDRDAGTMHPGAAPNLPSAYVAAIDGVPIGPDVGSCGTAAWTGQLTISEDLEVDPKWAAVRPLIRAAGVRHCWSQPIKAPDGEVLGTFALYGPRPRAPLPEHLALMRDAARLTGIAIERHRATRRLVQEATHDGLTGLLNRTAVLVSLEGALARSRRTGNEMAVMFVDLDRLKLLNDTLGHDLTDDVMRRIAGHLGAAVRAADTVGRFGGDEYLVIAEDIGGADAAAALAGRLLEAISAPIPELSSAAVTASIGITLVHGATADARDAIRQADSAMYSAKRAGGDRFGFYEDDPRPQAGRRLSLAAELRGAAQREELHLVFQPIFDLADGSMSAVEALLRWNSPSMGEVTPAEFVPVAEEIGVIGAIGAWVLLASCRAMAAATASAGRSVGLAVNVSAHQVADPGFARTVRRALSETGFSARRLALEITETALMKPDAVTARTLRDLKALGSRVVLDDFGTGYSSLASLKGHPVDVIKIDRGFVDGLPDDPEDSAIVTAVIGMAKALGRSVTAEGVETERQLAALRELGCDQVQGFLLGRPVAADELPSLLL